jgi:hypothetical protein
MQEGAPRPVRICRLLETVRRSVRASMMQELELGLAERLINLAVAVGPTIDAV